MTRRPRGTWLWVVLVAGIALLAAFVLLLSLQTRPNGPAFQELRITSVIRRAEFGFEPTTLRVSAQAPIRLTFDNRKDGPESGRGVPHSFTIDAWPRVGWLSRIFGHSVDIEVSPDGIATGEFQLQAGTYEFYCSVFNHREAGMVGLLAVE